CIYYGVPPSPKAPSSTPRPSFVGFFYWSAGLALLYAALDQGQRLDWWGSGVFTALAAAGIFLVTSSAARGWRRPNLFVDLPYLWQWNTMLLALGLFAFRFVLLATILIVPQSLSVRGLDAGQFGQAVLWTATAQLGLGVFAAYLLNKGADSRFVMAIGFAMI